MKNPIREFYEHRLDSLIEAFPRGSHQTESKKSEASYYRILSHLDAQRLTRNGLGDCVLDINVELASDGSSVEQVALREIVDIGEDGLLVRQYNGSPQELSLRALRSVCVEMRRVRIDLFTGNQTPLPS